MSCCRCCWWTGLLLLAVHLKFIVWAADGDAVFIREFTLIRQDPEEALHDYSKPEDQSSRTARSEEDRDTLWDAWGSWSECSRTCGGGASYALRRCLSSKTCEGQNIKYRTCSNVDCPPDAGDFRAQQCSAHADVRYEDQFHDWLPVYNDPDNPCSLRCKAKASGLVVELAPKVLDGTRCYTESLDMCISGVCQIVGCDHELGSTTKEDNCGICKGDGSSCRLVRGHYKSQHASGKTEDTVVQIPFKSRHVRLVLKGPDHLWVESKTLLGVRSELTLDKTGHYYLDNTSLDFQKFPDKEVLRMTGPLGADFTVKVQFSSGPDSVVQYIYYQPIIHRWRETDFFPCSVTCGGGYQLTSAECFDLRSGRVVADQFCLYYPENIKPKPKLQECNMELCLDSDGYKEIMPYDLYHPLPRWENSPWTACSTSCGGGIQSRSVSCVEEDMQGTITSTDEWKCLYSPKTAILQPCNTFDCPSWITQEWSPCTVTCGQGLRYRVVLCIDHRGLHAGGCNPTTKPHIKEDCLVTVPCYKSIDVLPVEAKPVWHKQAIELDQEVAVSEEPTFVPGPWLPCSRTCGAAIQHRTVKCQVLLSFSQTVADVPDDECKGVKPASSQPCYRTPCLGTGEEQPEEQEMKEEKQGQGPPQKEELHDWEYEGFTECSQSCGGGVQEAVVICLNKQTREPAEQNLCESSRRPPQLLQDCQTQPCPPRWRVEEWSSCSATCGVGLMTRSVVCAHQPFLDSNRSVILRNEDCLEPKPSPVQACNRFDCPPMWNTLEWGKCSKSCGGGLQRRQVLCKQRLADGSVLELPESFCASKKPPSHQPCGGKNCPPQWITTDWSQCSVSCGHGVQTLNTICRIQGERGQYWTVDVKNCSKLARPARARPCFLRNCEDSPKLELAALPLKKVYIQWRKGRRVQLSTGGYVYLLPWTTIVLRCPSRNVRKAHVQWLKNGLPLQHPPNLSISSQGSMKIQQVHPSDAGVYTCVMGQAQEHFVLQIIGSKHKLSVLESWLQEGGQNKVQQPVLTRGRLQGNLVSLSRYDTLVEILLGLRGSFPNEKDVASKPHSSQSNKSTVEKEGGSNLNLPALLTIESRRLDEIIHDFSESPGGAGAEQALAQLLHELIDTQGETNESTLHPKDRAKPSTNKPNISKAEKPSTSQQASKAEGAVQAQSVIYLGMPVVLQKPVAALELRCGALGDPSSTISWTKNGKELQMSSRIGLLPSGSLKIQAPSKEDDGLYTCRSRNHLGSASFSSFLQITTGKGKSCAHINRMGGSSSVCPPRANSSRSTELCAGQGCHLRWHLDTWSTCSASCGGGSQTRRVHCVLGPVGRSREVESGQCLSAGRRPASTRMCNMSPCAKWVTTSWGPCRGQCLGPSLATQHRHVFCQDVNGTKATHGMCSALRRPSSVRNCSTEACALRWHVGPWTQCTATCGRHGFQSRHVTCRHPLASKVTREHHCMWRPRPSSWQRCNILSCGRGECRDSTRYCEKVRRLDLCLLPQFKRRCCLSCQDT